MAEYKNFDELKTSTKTIMVYTNMNFNLTKLFHLIPIVSVELPTTKKIKTKDINVPFGQIFSVQNRSNTRGLDTRTMNPKKPPKIATPVKKIEHFLNQLSISLSLEDHHVHMMLFSDNIKIAGCRSDESAIMSIMILYKDYLKPLHEETFTLKQDQTKPLFIFDTVMRNVDFSLGFDIDREKMNNVLNLPEYKENIFLSQFETTEQKNVNMKIYSKKPRDFGYICYSPEEDKIRKVKNSFHNPCDWQLYNSFLIFSSSKVILSGKYDKDMRDCYNFYIDIIKRHKNDVIEKIEAVTDKDKQEFMRILGQ